MGHRYQGMYASKRHPSTHLRRGLPRKHLLSPQNPRNKTFVFPLSFLVGLVRVELSVFFFSTATRAVHTKFLSFFLVSFIFQARPHLPP